MFVSEQYYRTSDHSLILQDDEPKSVYADPAQRKFNTAAPLQLSVADDGRFHARFYSPRPLSDVTVRALIPGAGSEYLDLAYFDHIPALPTSTARCRSRSAPASSAPSRDGWSASGG